MEDENKKLNEAIEKYINFSDRKTDNNSNAYIPPHLRKGFILETTKQDEDKNPKALYVPPHLRKSSNEAIKQNKEINNKKILDINTSKFKKLNENQKDEEKSFSVLSWSKLSYAQSQDANKSNYNRQHNQRKTTIGKQNEEKRFDRDSSSRNQYSSKNQSDESNWRRNYQREITKPKYLPINQRQTPIIKMPINQRPIRNLNESEKLDELLEKNKGHPENMILSFEDPNYDLDNLLNTAEMDNAIITKLTAVLNEAFECNSIQTMVRNKIEKIVESNYFKEHLYNVIETDKNNLKLIEGIISLCTRFLILHPICRVKLGLIKDRLELLILDEKLKESINNLVKLDEDAIIR